MPDDRPIGERACVAVARASVRNAIQPVLNFVLDGPSSVRTCSDEVAFRSVAAGLRCSGVTMLLARREQ
jgi:hypothetical protein